MIKNIQIHVTDIIVWFYVVGVSDQSFAAFDLRFKSLKICCEEKTLGF